MDDDIDLLPAGRSMGDHMHFRYLEDIADAFESCMSEWAQFLNTKTGEIVSVPEAAGFIEFDEEDEELWEEIEEADYFRYQTFLRMAEEWCREHKVRYFGKD